MKIIFSDNKSQDIIEDYAMQEIYIEDSKPRSIHGIKSKSSTILDYASSEMRNMLDEQRKGKKQFDWDALTYWDENGELIHLVCDRIDSLDQKQRDEISEKIVNKLLENAAHYYNKEFEEKYKEAKDYYRQHRNFDNWRM